jgi:hypothetical protein
MSLIDLSKYNFDSPEILRLNELIDMPYETRRNDEIGRVGLSLLNHYYKLQTNFDSTKLPGEKIYYYIKCTDHVSNTTFKMKALVYELPNHREFSGEFRNKFIYLPDQYLDLSTIAGWRFKEIDQATFEQYKNGSFLWEDYIEHVMHEQRQIHEREYGSREW